jgi:phospholipase/carboxylesterase/glyoxalase family protein
MHAVDPLSLFHHRFVPAEPNGSPLLLLLLHGTGGDEDDMLPLGPYLAPGAALLSPRGRVLENGAPRFFRRIAEGVFDEEDLKHRVDELAQFVHAARDRYGVAARPMVAVGFSNGANIAGALLLLHPGLLDQAVLLRGTTPFMPETMPSLAGKRVYIAAGRNDPIVPPYESKRWAELLRSADAAVTIDWRDAGHSLTQDEIDAVRAWIDKKLE